MAYGHTHYTGEGKSVQPLKLSETEPCRLNTTSPSRSEAVSAIPRAVERRCVRPDARFNAESITPTGNCVPFERWLDTARRITVSRMQQRSRPGTHVGFAWNACPALSVSCQDTPKAPCETVRLILHVGITLGKTIQLASSKNASELLRNGTMPSWT